MARVCLGNIKGPKGDPGPAGPAGPQGEPGYTPVKGVDYFTEEDISSILAMGVSDDGSSGSDVIGLTESTDYPGCYYRMVNGEQEWLNPPMRANFEYRTMDRYIGRVVFKQAMYVDELPNGATKTMTINTPTGEIAIPIRCYGYTSNGFTLPCYTSTLEYDLYAYNNLVSIHTSNDASSLSAVVTVEYLKENY